MADYGDTQEPGITTDLESALSVGTGGESPATPALVGQADLATASDPANPAQVYLITRITDARNKFGDEATSMLTQNIIDCFNEGGAPVYAAATEEVSVVGEDISGVGGTSGTLANAPVIEDDTQVTFTVDGAILTTLKTYNDPANQAPAADEAYYNPVSGKFELGTAPGDTDTTNDTVDYTWYDYQSAFTAFETNSEVAEEIDILGNLNENLDVRLAHQTTATNLASDYDLALAVTSPGVRVDPVNYVQDFDDSRMVTVYPSRNGSDDSTIGSYVGERARLGISTTPINQRLETQRDLAVNLSRAERGSLIDERVVPLAQESAGARIADDPTTVDPQGNQNDRNVNFGFSRLVLDYIIETAYVNQRPFIGKLNSPKVRRTLEDLINAQLSALTDSNVILAYNVAVEPVDATSVTLDIGVETAKPLRHIENKVTVGDTS